MMLSAAPVRAVFSTSSSDRYYKVPSVFGIRVSLSFLFYQYARVAYNQHPSKDMIGLLWDLNPIMPTTNNSQIKTILILINF